MEPSKAVKEYKEELVKSQKQNERLTALVGKVTLGFYTERTIKSACKIIMRKINVFYLYNDFKIDLRLIKTEH
jgi:hypothetical protein